MIEWRRMWRRAEGVIRFIARPQTFNEEREEPSRIIMGHIHRHCLLFGCHPLGASNSGSVKLFAGHFLLLYGDGVGIGMGIHGDEKSAGGASGPRTLLAFLLLVGIESTRRIRLHRGTLYLQNVKYCIYRNKFCCRTQADRLARLCLRTRKGVVWWKACRFEAPVLSLPALVGAHHRARVPAYMATSTQAHKSPVLHAG